MATTTFEEALTRVLAHEGGYVNHPADPGGPTNHGITLTQYAAFRGAKVTAAEVRAMPLADAKAIYRATYWDRMGCDRLPTGLDYALFDYGVNSGTGRAPKVLQRLCGLPDDGRLTEAVLAALAKQPVADLINRLCDERLAFLRRLKTWPTFGAGWRRRVAEVRTGALRMASAKAPGSSRSDAPRGIVKAAPAACKGVVPLNTGARGGVAGVIVVAGAAAAQQAHHGAASSTLIVAIAVATGIAAVAMWVAWRWRQRRRQEAPVPPRA